MPLPVVQMAVMQMQEPSVREALNVTVRKSVTEQQNVMQVKLQKNVTLANVTLVNNTSLSSLSSPPSFIL